MLRASNWIVTSCELHMVTSEQPMLQVSNWIVTSCELHRVTSGQAMLRIHAQSQHASIIT